MSKDMKYWNSLIHTYLLKKGLTIPKSLAELDFFEEQIEKENISFSENPISGEEMLKRIKDNATKKADIHPIRQLNDESKKMMSRAARKGGKIDKELEEKMHKDRFTNSDQK